MIRSHRARTRLLGVYDGLYRPNPNPNSNPNPNPNWLYRVMEQAAREVRVAQRDQMRELLRDRDQQEIARRLRLCQDYYLEAAEERSRWKQLAWSVALFHGQTAPEGQRHAPDAWAGVMANAMQQYRLVGTDREEAQAHLWRTVFEG